MSPFESLIDPLLHRRDFSPAQAEQLMQFLMSGEANDAQIGGILLGLRIKGCTTKELAAFAKVLRARALTIFHQLPNLVDTCGTGGGIQSFNISTAAAIVAAAAGAPVAKHGNRAVTSTCGSADVLEALGVNLTADPERHLKCLETLGLVFLFAPHHHPALKAVGAARKSLGVRTVFNQLGPLLNPANATRQLIGVYDAGLMRSMGEALNVLGTERAILAHGKEGLDEVSPCGLTEVVKVWGGVVSNERLSPETFEQDAINIQDLAPSDSPPENGKLLLEAISDMKSLKAVAVVPSAAVAVWLAGVEDSLPAAASRVRRAIESGAASLKLKELIAFTNEP